MTDDEIGHAAFLWRVKRMDTRDIARELRLPEATIHNYLGKIRERGRELVA